MVADIEELERMDALEIHASEDLPRESDGSFPTLPESSPDDGEARNDF